MRDLHAPVKPEKLNRFLSSRFAESVCRCSFTWFAEQQEEQQVVLALQFTRKKDVQPSSSFLSFVFSMSFLFAAYLRIAK